MCVCLFDDYVPLSIMYAFVMDGFPFSLPGVCFSFEESADFFWFFFFFFFLVDGWHVGLPRDHLFLCFWKESFLLEAAEAGRDR